MAATAITFARLLIESQNEPCWIGWGAVDEALLLPGFTLAHETGNSYQHQAVELDYTSGPLTGHFAAVVAGRILVIAGWFWLTPRAIEAKQSARISSSPVEMATGYDWMPPDALQFCVLKFQWMDQTHHGKRGWPMVPYGFRHTYSSFFGGDCWSAAILALASSWVAPVLGEMDMAMCEISFLWIMAGDTDDYEWLIMLYMLWMAIVYH